MVLTKRKRKEKIKKIETELLRLGLAGLAYTEKWNEVAKELEKLKEEK